MEKCPCTTGISEPYSARYCSALGLSDSVLFSLQPRKSTQARPRHFVGSRTDAETARSKPVQASDGTREFPYALALPRKGGGNTRSVLRETRHPQSPEQRTRGAPRGGGRDQPGERRPAARHAGQNRDRSA